MELLPELLSALRVERVDQLRRRGLRALETEVVSLEKVVPGDLDAEPAGDGAEVGQVEVKRAVLLIKDHDGRPGATNRLNGEIRLVTRRGFCYDVLD